MKQPRFVVSRRALRDPDCVFTFENHLCAAGVARYIEWLHRDDPDTTVVVERLPGPEDFAIVVFNETGTFYLSKEDL